MDPAYRAAVSVLILVFLFVGDQVYDRWADKRAEEGYNLWVQRELEVEKSLVKNEEMLLEIRQIRTYWWNALMEARTEKDLNLPRCLGMSLFIVVLARFVLTYTIRGLRPIYSAESFLRLFVCSIPSLWGPSLLLYFAGTDIRLKETIYVTIILTTASAFYRPVLVSPIQPQSEPPDQRQQT